MKAQPVFERDVLPLADASLQELMREMLIRIRRDGRHNGAGGAPARVERSMRYFTKGYDEDPAEILRSAIVNVAYGEMAIVRNIEMFSLCEHHILPFFGMVHVAYIPRRRVIGLSKVVRLVDVFARRLQVQERLTTQISAAIENAINPHGVGVVIQARHLSMMMRGVETQHSTTITSSMRGAFRMKETREEFLSLIHLASGPR